MREAIGERRTITTRPSSYPLLGPVVMDHDERFCFDEDWAEIDPNTFHLDGLEDLRQTTKIILIAALSMCPMPVRQALTSKFCNVDAEGFPPGRMSQEEAHLLLDSRRQLAYYRRYGDSRANKCTDYANSVEVLAQRRLAHLLTTAPDPNHRCHISADDVFVNIQPLSGAIANTAIFDALLEPGDTILSMSLSHGGHLSHASPLHRSGRTYTAVHYGVDPATGRLDYAEIEALAQKHKPKLILAGASSYPWDIDWARLRGIVDRLPGKAYLMADIAHTVGLVIAGLFPNPVGYADVTSLVTYKTLCGPRGAAIVTTDEALAQKIDRAVFPGLQSAPLFQNIVAIAVALRIAQTEKFRRLQHRIVLNAQALAAGLRERGLRIAYGGTNTHLVVADLSAIKTRSGYPLSGEIAARILDLSGIVCNKNLVPGDTSATYASGLRFGTTWVSQLGMAPGHMEQIADTIHALLTHIETFSYAGLRREQSQGGAEAYAIPRGKIDYDVLEAARSRAAGILQPFVAETSYLPTQARPIASGERLL
ncbi:MAG TPA: serine hydroxymethyltransferase, partial [Herpetosiphonaceae bacterium]|nr:serine hydroxymethyltransferase [Herpetosiphonaceae bacterium]